MEENSDDLIKQFKSKVEEAISILPQIPEAQRDEVWTYWQIISVAVKAAVGGRGPFVAKQAATGQKRPRGRPRLHHVQPVSAHSADCERQKDQKVNKESDGVKRNKNNSGTIVGLDRNSRLELLSAGQQVTVDAAGNSRVSPFESSLNHASPTDESNAITIINVPTSSVIGGSIEGASEQVCLNTPMPVANGIYGSAREHIECISGQVETQYDEALKTLLLNEAVLPPEDTFSQKTIHVEETSPEESERLKNDSSEVSQTLITLSVTPDTLQTSQPQAMSSDEISKASRPLFKTSQTGDGVSQMLETEVEISQTSCIPVNETSQVLDTANDEDSLTLEAVVDETSQSVGTLVTETWQTVKAAGELVKTVHTQAAKCVTDITPVSTAVGTPATASTLLKTSPLAAAPQKQATVKRKRGRPPKGTVKVKNTSCSVSLNTMEVETVDQVNTASTEASKMKIFHAKTSGSLQSDLKEIISALDLEEKTEKAVGCVSSSQVRRSVRRITPNRDKIFCYFAPTRQGEEEDVEEKKVEEMEEEEEEEDGISAVQIPEKQRSDAKQEDNKEVRMKTEAEKLQERTCPTCQAVLMSASSMAAHMRIHTGERPFACPVCHKTFTTKGNCERHEVTHVGLKAFTCTQCNKKFTEKKSLKIHMRGHTGERPYQCKICGMRFFQSGTLKTHMDRHTGHKGHLCELCGKTFRQSCQLRVHMQRHTMHMPFSCQSCFKTFYTKSDMERHQLKHREDRPFSCDQCSKTFTKLQYLHAHQNTHLGRRPYRCVVCDMTFHDFAACNRHVSKHAVSDSNQPAQQIHVEVTPDTPREQVLEQVQLILNQQSQSDQHNSHIQTLIIPEQLSNNSTVTSSSASVQSSATSSSVQSSAHTILSTLGLEVEESPEIFHVTLVNPVQAVTISTDPSMSPSVSTSADFSAINLLANATTQLSAPQ